MTTTQDLPTLQTARLTLRQFTLADVDALHQILQTPDILRYFPTQATPSYERTARIVARQLEQWQSVGYGWWALATRGDERLIGWCGLQFLPDTNETEVGYLLAPLFWGKGLATEAARAALTYGFDRFAFPELIGITHPDNIASQRVLQKAGMHFTRADRYFSMDCFRYAVAAPHAILSPATL
jgi:RimJ/RimL family protein N-acetyltransferase